jgi:hypothetical protein
MNDDRSFFVDSTGATSTPTTTAPTLGHVERRCNACHAPWELGQTACPKCHGQVFDETSVQGTLFERVGGAIKAVVLPAKPRAPRATAVQTSALRGFAVSLEHFRTELARLDELLRAGVADGVEELQPAHNILHQATFTSGDTSMESVRFLSLGLRSLSVALPSVIEPLEETP